jgi:hypothetical protein
MVIIEATPPIGTPWDDWLLAVFPIDHEAKYVITLHPSLNTVEDGMCIIIEGHLAEVISESLEYLCQQENISVDVLKNPKVPHNLFLKFCEQTEKARYPGEYFNE